eukprot:12395803-Ditylum_brightwellii.AAC.1
MADSDYTKCHIMHRSVSGYAIFLEDAPINVKSVMQKVMALLVMEAETITGVQCTHNMLYCKHILGSMGLKVELPVVLYIDNIRAVDLANNWSVEGCTRHMEMRMFFLHDLKESGVLEIKWLKGVENPVDIFTNNLAGPAYN